MKQRKSYGCTAECKPKWRKGKGSFEGWRLKLCSRHQIIHAMKKVTSDGKLT